MCLIKKLILLCKYITATYLMHNNVENIELVMPNNIKILNFSNGGRNPSYTWTGSNFRANKKNLFHNLAIVWCTLIFVYSMNVKSLWEINFWITNFNLAVYCFISLSASSIHLDKCDRFNGRLHIASSTKLPLKTYHITRFIFTNSALFFY